MNGSPRLSLVRRCAFGAAALAVAAVPARAGEIDVQYAVSLAGLTLGAATLTGAVTKQKYTLNAQASLTGLAGMVTGGKGAATATGGIDAGRVVSGAYSLSAANSEMTRTIQMGLNGGAVDKLVVNPPLDDKPDRIAVTGAHKVGVVDPLGAVLMPTRGAGLEQACNRSIPVFDGAQRFNIELSYAGTRMVQAKDGYAGPVAMCKVRYTPIAGHRSERPAVKFMAGNRDMDVWLAPSGVEGVYLPFRVSVKTMIGTTVLQAVKFRTEGAETTATVRR